MLRLMSILRWPLSSILALKTSFLLELVNKRMWKCWKEKVELLKSKDNGAALSQENSVNLEDT